MVPVRPPAAPLRKPMAAARRVSLFEREIRYRLSTPALHILFDVAHVISEGQRQGPRYFGSTMLTIDLAAAAAVVREACDEGTARRVASLLGSDPRACARARVLALAAAEDRARATIVRPIVDVRVRASGAAVHIDVDVEGEVAGAPALRVLSRRP
jgi:hypothetical protein